jgi:hypothetical protein
MNLKRLLEKGYLPKELPPPFSSKLFAEKHRFIKSKWDFFNQKKKNQKKSHLKHSHNNLHH